MDKLLNRRHRLAFLFLLLTLPWGLRAHEGMWLPHLLKAIEGNMQEMGMKMTAEQIYSVNHSSLKDAVLQFGGGCTASIISSTGLVLTNHHCGYGQVQSHSSVENNLLRNGFWAENHAAELPNKGLTVTMIRRIEDVTDIALAGVTPEMTEAERQSRIDANLKAYEPNVVKEKDEGHFFRPIYYGNQYLLFVTLTFRDVRLVGTPPESIGKFGADTDNWVWPRHTGDFMLFRIYAGADNRPADYSADNKPYVPDHFLPVSLDGVAEGDFTLVFGFPGRTQQYLTASAVAMNLESINPPRIAIRDTTLKILNKAMRADEAVRIQYASKYAGIANAWKKWIGENLGLAETGAVKKRREYEKKYRERMKDDPAVSLPAELDSLFALITPYQVASQYHGEIVQRNTEIFTPARVLATLAKRHADNGEAGYAEYLPRATSALQGFYKDYSPAVDREVFTALMRLYAARGDRKLAHPDIFSGFSGKAAASRAEELFAQSVLDDQEAMMALLAKSPAEVLAAIAADPVVQLYERLQAHYTEQVGKPMAALQDRIDTRMRAYMAAQMKAFPERAFYPDANSTLRVTYGKVEGYQPAGKPRYESQTWLSGVMAKYVPGDYEFDVPARLRQLEETADYGPYGHHGRMPVCFIGSNHTTGGNSGSPALDAKGNLIGLNFDRVWEGTMSDLNFDPSICRNIMVDARYILFIIDKFAGARHLVEEMTLVRPKRG